MYQTCWWNRAKRKTETQIAQIAEEILFFFSLKKNRLERKAGTRKTDKARTR